MKSLQLNQDVRETIYFSTVVKDNYLQKFSK